MRVSGLATCTLPPIYLHTPPSFSVSGFSRVFLYFLTYSLLFSFLSEIFTRFFSVGKRGGGVQ